VIINGSVCWCLKVIKVPFPTLNFFQNLWPKGSKCQSLIYKILRKLPKNTSSNFLTVSCQERYPLETRDRSPDSQKDSNSFKRKLQRTLRPWSYYRQKRSLSPPSTYPTKRRDQLNLWYVEKTSVMPERLNLLLSSVGYFLPPVVLIHIRTLANAKRAKTRAFLTRPVMVLGH